MFSSQLQPTLGDGDEQRVDISLASIGRTNRLHSEEEQLHIRNVLLAAESLLQSGTVDGDLRRREETVDLIDRCKIALAPHKRLPPDVLRFIFQICHELKPWFSSTSSWSRADTCLLYITHVCSAWRRLALETPALWNNIGVYLSRDARLEQHIRTLSFARHWFDRAQDMRRSLFIDFDVEAYSPHLHDSWEQLLEFMAQYDRLEELDLEYPINSLALKLPDHVWPSIERLHLVRDGERPSEGQQLFSNFGKLSNLGHLKISGSRYLDGMDRIVPWHQLRTLKVEAVTPSSCLNVLRQSRLLEHCCITLSKELSFTSTVISTKENIVLADMDHFEAEFSDGLAVPMFLQPLVMPNIARFCLRRAGPYLPKLSCDMSALIGIIQRSGGMRRIRRLRIDASFPALDIGIFLELLPSLESISIESGYLDDNTITRLSTGKLGPRLCDIDLCCLHDADQILSMVESRYQNATQSPDSEQNTPCPFRFIRILCKAPVNDDRIDLLFEKCDAIICLDFDKD